MNFMRKVKMYAVPAIGFVSAGISYSANAADAIDLTSITGAVSSADIVTGVLAIAATLAVAYMTIKAAKIVINVLKSA